MPRCKAAHGMASNPNVAAGACCDGSENNGFVSVALVAATNCRNNNGFMQFIINMATGSVRLMRNKRTLLISLFLLLSATATAFEPFRVQRIEVQGLKRITTGTVLNYLPFAEGETLTPGRSREIVRSLYKTGFFRNIELDNRGGVLVLRVEERPAIASIEFDGNKKIKTEQLEDGVKQAGLENGSLFERSVIEQLVFELRRQYFANGFYGVKVDTEVIERDKNQVDIKVNVDEGAIAKIREINIIGNELYSDKVLLKQFDLSTPRWNSFYKKNDQYSQFKLSSDLEKLTSFYQDRGYLRFQIDSVQVSLSDDKRDVYITVNVEEGDQYRVSKVDVAGDYSIPQDELERLVPLREGDVFSRSSVTFATEAISRRMGREGYAFTNVNPVPKIDDDALTVDVTLFVEPGKQTYVRRIVFRGNAKTNDDVLRREMRVFEGGLFTNESLERSRQRVARLPYIEGVDFKTEPVPGAPDLVDIEFEVSERAPGAIQFGVGFSGSSGFLVNANVTHSNWLGAGNRVQFDATRNELSTSFSASFTEPYFRPSGISRTVSGFYRESDAANINSSTFITNSLGGGLSFGYPISEFTRVSAGLSYRLTELFTSSSTSTEVTQFAVENGSNFDALKANFSLSRDNRNRSLFATKGSLNRLTLSSVVPGFDLEYYEVDYRLTNYLTLPAGFTLEIDSRVGITETYGDTTVIPPFSRLFGGGSETVRGYRDGSLGPRDSNNRAFGGGTRYSTQFELILPGILASNNKSTRFVVFGDVGNVWEDIGDFDSSELRGSAGVGFYWLTPILGIMRFSYAVPINDQPDDRLDRFQFTFGVPF